MKDLIKEAVNSRHNLTFTTKLRDEEFKYSLKSLFKEIVVGNNYYYSHFNKFYKKIIKKFTLLNGEDFAIVLYYDETLKRWCKDVFLKEESYNQIRETLKNNSSFKLLDLKRKGYISIEDFIKKYNLKIENNKNFRARVYKILAYSPPLVLRETHKVSLSGKLNYETFRDKWHMFIDKKGEAKLLKSNYIKNLLRSLNE